MATAARSPTLRPVDTGRKCGADCIPGLGLTVEQANEYIQEVEIISAVTSIGKHTSNTFEDGNPDKDLGLLRSIFGLQHAVYRKCDETFAQGVPDSMKGIHFVAPNKDGTWGQIATWAKNSDRGLKDKLAAVIEDMIKKNHPDAPWDEQLKSFRFNSNGDLASVMRSWADELPYIKLTYLLGKKACTLHLQWIFLVEGLRGNKQDTQQKLSTHFRNLTCFSLLRIYWRLFSTDCKPTDDNKHLVPPYKLLRIMPTQEEGAKEWLPPPAAIPCYQTPNTKVKLPAIGSE